MMLTSYTDDSWAVYIRDTLRVEYEVEERLRNCSESDNHEISICQVPKSLKSAKQEAFIPQFVGLGLYHHFRHDLIMTDGLKLAAAQRALKGHLHHLDDGFKHFVPMSDVVDFYHTDVTCKYNDQTLLYVLAVDSFFLLGMLHRGPSTNRNENSYFLTGKRGMPLVNASGVELTMDVLVRDVFMLENQVPTHFLKKLWEVIIIFNEVEEIQIDQPGPDEKYNMGMGSSMKVFCEAFCPLVRYEQLSKFPEDHDHLLDIMYNMIVPDDQSQPPTHLDLEDENKEGRDPPLPLPPPPQSQPQPQSMSSFEEKEPCEESQQEEEEPEIESTFPGYNCIITCMCICIYTVILLMIPFIFMGFILNLIWECFKGLMCNLFHVVQWTLRLLINLPKYIYPMVEWVHSNLQEFEADYPVLKPYTKLFERVKRILGKFQRDSSSSTNNVPGLARTIPSATELHKAGIHFKALLHDGGGISSIHFNETNCEFYLPCIRMDVNSEVIMRNLVAYESLTKSKDLVFTRYIEMMRGIIVTHEDVHLLAVEEIIHTELSDELVTQIFLGMSKPIRPTKAQKLEQEINKVIVKFHTASKLQRDITTYVSCIGKMLTTIAALVFLVLTAVQTYCTAMDCSRTSKYGKLPVDGDHGSRNNYFITSM